MKPIFLQYCPQIFDLPKSAQHKFVKFITSEIQQMKYRDSPADKTHSFVEVLQSIVQLHHERGGKDDHKPEVFLNLLTAKYNDSWIHELIREELFALKLGFIQFELEGGQSVLSLLHCQFRPHVRDRMIQTIATNGRNFLQVSSTITSVLSHRQFTHFKNLVTRTSDLHINQPEIQEFLNESSDSEPEPSQRTEVCVFEKYMPRILRSTPEDQVHDLEQIKEQLRYCEIFPKPDGRYQLYRVFEQLVKRAEESGIQDNLPTYEMFLALDSQSIPETVRLEYESLQLAFLRFYRIRKINYLSAWRKRYCPMIRHMVFHDICKFAEEYLQSEKKEVLSSNQITAFQEIIDRMYPICSV